MDEPCDIKQIFMKYNLTEDSINQINTILKGKKPKNCKETEEYLRDAFR